MIFLNGVVKVLFSALSIAVIAAMVASYFAAMMVIPLFTAYYLNDGEKPAFKALGAVQDWLARVNDAYGRSLMWVVGRRGVVLPAVIVILLALGLGFVGSIGTQLFPRADAGGFRLDLRGPTGYRLEDTTALARKVEASLREIIAPRDLKTISAN